MVFNRMWLSIGVLGVIIFLVIWFDGAITEGPNSANEEVSNIVDSYFNNVRTNDFDKEGKLSVTLRSEHAERFLGSSIVHLQNPHIIYEAQNPPWYGTADVGEYDTDKEIVTLEDNVVLHRADDSARLTTEMLTYKKREDLIETPDEVVITAPEGTTKGLGMTLDLTTETVTLHQAVESIYDPTKAPKK